MQRFAGVWFVVIVVLVLGYFGYQAHQHTYKPHTIRHRDGRVFHLKGAPFGHGLNGCLPFHDGGCYHFLDTNGFRMKLKKEDCILTCEE